MVVNSVAMQASVLSSWLILSYKAFWSAICIDYINDFERFSFKKRFYREISSYDRVWHKKAIFRSSQKIHDVVFFNEKLTYCKTNETVFNQYLQKLGIPQGGNQMSPKL